MNSVLLELLTGVQNILGPHFVGMYLYGSLANGDFDQDSDVDFVVVTDNEISADLFWRYELCTCRLLRLTHGVPRS